MVGGLGRHAMRLLLVLATGLILCLPASAGDTRVGVAAFALWNAQGVFPSEAGRAAAILGRRYSVLTTVVRANTRKHLAGDPVGLRAGIAAAARGLDPARDIEIVVLTSHGSPEGIAEMGGGIEGVLTPSALADVLQAGPTRLKVLIVSACYSGIFIPLAGPDLLVISAADAEHPSFGCTATAKWTYFGEAFFGDALAAAVASHAPLDAVFREAAALVRARETKEGFEPSNPQIAGGAHVLEALATAGRP